jgi:hypothetical protein
MVTCEQLMLLTATDFITGKPTTLNATLADYFSLSGFLSASKIYQLADATGGRT